MTNTSTPTRRVPRPLAEVACLHTLFLALVAAGRDDRAAAALPTP